MGDLNIMEKTMFFLNMKSPITRFAGVFVATDVIVWLLKPCYFFNKDTDQPNPDAVVPWWALGLVTGGAAALLLSVGSHSLTKKKSKINSRNKK